MERRGPSPVGGDDGNIVFAGYNSGIDVIAADGGSVRTLTSPEGEVHASPMLLPGSEAVLFYVQRGESTTAKVLKLDSMEQMTLIENANYPRYVSSGHLLFVREGGLWAVFVQSRSTDPCGDAGVTFPQGRLRLASLERADPTAGCFRQQKWTPDRGQCPK